MNGKIKVERHTLEDGLVVVRVNGHIIPNVAKLQYEALDDNDFPTLKLTLRDVEFVETDDRERMKLWDRPDYRASVEEAYHDGRTISFRRKEPQGDWYQCHHTASPLPEHSFNWDYFNYSFIGDAK